MLRLSALLAVAGLALVAMALGAPMQPAARSDPAAYGRALFAAKGCATCHSHAQIARSGEFAAGIGPDGFAPDLTNRPLDADYLRRWLRDPAAVRPATTMPNLALSETEIDALVAFLQPSN